MADTQTIEAPQVEDQQQTPPQTDPVETYYNYLKKAGADVAPNLDSFKKTLSNDKTAQQYYNYLKQNKFDAPPTYGSFARTLGITQAPPPPPAPAPPPQPEHEVSHNPLQDIRHVQEMANKPVETVADPVGGGFHEKVDPSVKAASDAYKAQYDKMAGDMAASWGVKPETVKGILQDFPDEQNEQKLKEYAVMATANPIAYNRLKNANDIRMAIAKDGPHGVNDANIFNHLQNADNYTQLAEENIPYQQQLMREHNLGQDAFDKLRESQRPLINALDPGLLGKMWNSSDKELGLSDNEYAGLETERLFNPNKAAMDLGIIKHSRGIGDDGKAAPLDMSTQPYDYQRGVENVKYNLEKLGRDNLQKYLMEKKPDVDKQVAALKDDYQARINAAPPQEQAALIQEFTNHPIVQEANKFEDAVQQLQYSESEDNRRYPLNFADQAERVVKDAMDNTTGFGAKLGGVVLRGAGENADNTMRWFKNAAINLAGSEEQRSFNNAKNIGYQSVNELAGYQPTSLSGTQSPLNVPREMVKDVHDIFNEPGLSDDRKEQKALNYISDNFDKLTVNTKAGQHNLTGKAALFQAANVMGQILGVANQSFLLGGVIGDASKLQKMATAFTPMYMSTQNQMYEQALKNGDENPLLKSNIDATILSLASLINPDIKVVKGMVGAETGVGKMIAGIDEGTWNKVLSTNKPVLDNLMGAAKATGRQIGLANLQYGVIAPTAQYLAHKSILGEDANLGDMIKDGVIQTNISMALPSLLHGVWGGARATEVNPNQKYAIVEAGLHPDQNIDLVDSKIKAGVIPEIQGHEMKQLIKHAGEILQNGEFNHTDGSPMNENEVADLTYSMLRKKVLEGKMKNAPEPLKPIIEDKIHEINTEISDLHTSESDKHKNELNQMLNEHMDRIKDKAPEMEQTVKDAIADNNPEEAFKIISDKAKETKKVEGKEVSSREDVEKVFGKPLVEKAIELSKQKTKTNEKTSTDAEAQGRQEITEKPSEDSGNSVAAGSPESSFLESRHADTMDDEKGLVSGPNDAPISKDGRKDANDLAKEVEGKGVTKIITSDLQRAKQTGQVVADKTGATVEHRPELNTWDIGDFDKSSDEEFKKAQRFFVENPDAKDYEGKHVNESFNEYKDRVIKARAELQNEPASTLVVNHSNNMMLWDAYVKNGHEWNEQAAKDYLSAKTPEPATLTNKENAISPESGDSKQTPPVSLKGDNDLPWTEPNKTGIAERVKKERQFDTGVKAPEPGEGSSVQAMVDRGRELLDNGQDPEKVMQDFEEDKKISADGVALVRAKLEELAKITDKAVENHGEDSKEAETARTAESQWAERIQPMQTEWSKIGMAQQGAVELDTGSVITIKRAFREVSGKPLTEKQTETAKNLHAKIKAQETKISDLEQKLNDLINDPQSGKGIKEKAKDLAKKIRDKAKLSRPGMFSTATPASLVWDGAVEVVAKAVETGGAIADAIGKGIDHIKESDWYKGLSKKEQGTAVKQFEDWHKDQGTDKIDVATHFVDKKDDNFSPNESKAIWDHTKKVIESGKTDFHAVIGQVAMDTGLSEDQVRRAISQPKGAKVVTDQMYAATYRRTQVINQAKAWVKSADQSPTKKFITSILRIPSAIVTFGHGSVAPITHVGSDLYRPSNWKSYFNFMLDSYKYSFGGLTDAGKARYEIAMRDLVKDPMFIMAKRAGLKIDPTDLSGDDYSKYQGTLGRISKMGERGFNAMKPYRLEQFKQIYNGLSNQAKGNPDVVKSIADMVNLSTGTTSVKTGKYTDIVFFAPKLVTSQYQRIFTEPAKAITTFATWGSSTDAQKLQAKMVARHAGEMVATYAALLAANQAFLSMSGSKQKINFTNPLESDWMKFKVAGKVVDASGGMNSALRFVATLGQEAARANGLMTTKEKGKPGDVAGNKILQQAQNKLAPAAGDIWEAAKGTDPIGNPLPWSAVKPSAGKHKLSWAEYGASKAPIPLSEGVKTFVESAKENGMPQPAIERILQGVIVGGLAGTTGAKLGPDLSKKTESTERKPRGE